MTMTSSYITGKCFTFVAFSIFLYASASDLRIREDSKLFLRMNIKINSLMHTKVFAYAIGFRINFDLRKKKASKLIADNGLMNARFHPEHIREATSFLFNSYGWNGTACVTRTLCEIAALPSHTGDIMGPSLKILFLMRVLGKVLLILTVTASSLVSCQQELQHAVRTRKKRSLIFPKGTVVQLVYCYLMSALGTEGVFTVGVTLGTNWDVPVDLEKLMYDQNMKVRANRRDRRSLYPKIEFMLNKLNGNGKACIKSLLCRARQRQLDPRQRYSFVEEVILEIFRYPSLPSDQPLEPRDEFDHMLQNCDESLLVGCT